MAIFEILLIAIGLAMDAFAVSICKGLAMQKFKIKKAIIVALYFGIFQAIMPVIGYILGYSFSNAIQNVDHWVAFILLGSIGINMIKESYDNNYEKKNENVDFKNMIGLAIATSIDALAVGITFSFFKINLIMAILIIGIITFILSLVGVKLGHKFENKFQNKAELFGGIILILIGLKILLEHLSIIKF